MIKYLLKLIVIILIVICITGCHGAGSTQLNNQRNNYRTSEKSLFEILDNKFKKYTGNKYLFKIISKNEQFSYLEGNQNRIKDL